MLKQYNGRKRKIQYYFYQKVTTSSNVVALAGNNLDLHINDFKHIISRKNTKAYVYDMCEEVISKFKHLEQEHKLQLICDNILNCNIERFMDIDLMATLNSIQGIVYHLFNEQVMKYKNVNTKNINTFMFTYCLRKNTKDLNFFLESLLKDRQISISNVEHKTYRDGAPMCTVQIQWKYLNR